MDITRKIKTYITKNIEIYKDEQHGHHQKT